MDNTPGRDVLSQVRVQMSWRGHPIVEVAGVWLYADTGTPVADDPDRPCGACGLANTPDGHDGCIGEVPGLMNACCGHGTVSDAYAQRLDGIVVAGVDALILMGSHRRTL